jgi:hypothetical protein
VSSSFNIRPLAATLGADAAARRFPDHEPLWTVSSPGAQRHVGRFIRHLAEAHPLAYGAFGSEDELAIAVFDCFDTTTPPVSLAQLLDALSEASKTQWVIATPLLNVRPPPDVIKLADTRALAASADQDPALRRDRAGQLHRAIGASINVRERWDHADKPAVDTRHTASIVSVEQGSRTVSTQRAMTVARLALAVWTLLSPPNPEHGTPLWPTATEWQPQPHRQSEQRAMRIDGTDRRARGVTILYSADDLILYQIPDDPSRSAPFRAVELAATSHSAAALLSAAWNLYLAARTPTDLMWIDRLLLVMHAREALCAPPSGAPGHAQDRWKAALKRLDVASEMRRKGWTERDITEISSRGWDLRSLGAHTADASLLSLGYPPHRLRELRNGRTIPGAELAPLFIAQNTHPAYSAVTTLAASLWREMLGCDFDDTRWEQSFTL